ncbi:N-acetylmuramoyl-L-alanine amidase [Paenibacillus sp. KN14-4R]|uniref:N-acetylmuramoyl-L-alanine amidase n=1 Tax=Paenibacillus sp. KN14-4R TaxID=3445773 RepID=UPI003F9F30F6
MRFMRRCQFIILGTALLISSLLAAPIHAEAKGQDTPTICLDPGHQLYGNNNLEPVAPNSKEKKAKVSSGTRGVKTKKPEYVLTLEASLLLKEKLEAFGYKVYMTRDTHDINISNVDRAQICNKLQVDLAVRIHADGDSSPKTEGISLLYPALSQNTESIFTQSKEAADIILQETVAATGAVSRGVIPRSDLTGFNWTKVPSVLVEMGFMTNPEEDMRLSNSEYLNQLTEGIAKGIHNVLGTSTNDAIKDEQFEAYLKASTPLYEQSNGKMMRTSLALSPQLIEITSTKGNWGKVSTWVGERWVSLSQSIRPVKSVNKQLELSDHTPMYRDPSDKVPAAHLSSQKVNARLQWNEWYLIDTWLGEMWVK